MDKLSQSSLLDIDDFVAFSQKSSPEPLRLYLHRKLSRDSHAEMYSETAKLSQSMQHAWEQSAEMLVFLSKDNEFGAR